MESSRVLAIAPIIYPENIEFSDPITEAVKSFDQGKGDWELLYNYDRYETLGRNLVSDKDFLEDLGENVVGFLPPKIFTDIKVLEPHNITKTHVTKRYLNSVLRKYHSNENFFRTLLVAPHKINLYFKDSETNEELYESNKNGMAYRIGEKKFGRSCVVFMPWNPFYEKALEVFHYALTGLSTHELGHTFGLLHHLPYTDIKTMQVRKGEYCFMTPSFTFAVDGFCSKCYETVKKSI